MNRPLIEFLDPSTLEFICGAADYTSLVWENKTYGCGSIELHIPKADTRITHGLIIKLCRDIPEPYGIVMSVRLSEAETVVYASTLSKVFDWRYMQNHGPDVTLSTSEGDGKLICLCGKYGLIEDNSNDFFGKPAIFSYPVEESKSEIKTSITTSCLELMTSVAKEKNCCFGCTIEDGQLKLFSYRYTDKGQSLDVGTTAVGELVYTTSCDSHRNVFGYSVGSAEEGYAYNIYPRLNTYEGCDRRMLNLGRFSEIPFGIIREKEALLTTSEAVEAVINLPYPEKFALGDIINITNKQWGFSKNLEVTSVKEIWEQKYSCRVTFGFPPETVYRKMLRVYR